MERKIERNKKYVRYKEGAALYSMGIQSFMKTAKEAHAVIKIRNIALVNMEILDKYLEMFRKKKKKNKKYTIYSIQHIDKCTSLLYNTKCK